MKKILLLSLILCSVSLSAATYKRTLYFPYITGAWENYFTQPAKQYNSNGSYGYTNYKTFVVKY